MKRTVFEFVGDISHHFVAWQVRWQAFVPLLTRFATPVSRDQLGFFDRVCQARGRIVRFVGVAEVQAQLTGVGDVTFAACGKAFMPKLLAGQFQVLVLLLKLPDDVVFAL